MKDPMRSRGVVSEARPVDLKVDLANYQMSNECERDIETYRQATIWTPEQQIARLTAENASLRETIRLHGAWDFPKDIQDLNVRLETALARIKELEAEANSFSLAATQCATPAMTEHGHMECSALKAALARGEKAVGELYAAIQAGEQVDIWRKLAEARVTALESENAKLRAAFRVNALRWCPGLSHVEIDDMIARPSAMLRWIARHDRLLGRHGLGRHEDRRAVEPVRRDRGHAQRQGQGAAARGGSLQRRPRGRHGGSQRHQQRPSGGHAVPSGLGESLERRPGRALPPCTAWSAPPQARS
jgi:hypothetical protein